MELKEQEEPRKRIKTNTSMGMIFPKVVTINSLSRRQTYHVGGSQVTSESVAKKPL